MVDCGDGDEFCGGEVVWGECAGGDSAGRGDGDGVVWGGEEVGRWGLGAALPFG